MCGIVEPFSCVLCLASYMSLEKFVNKEFEFMDTDRFQGPLSWCGVAFLWQSLGTIRDKLIFERHILKHSTDAILRMIFSFVPMAGDLGCQVGIVGVVQAWESLIVHYRKWPSCQVPKCSPSVFYRALSKQGTFPRVAVKYSRQKKRTNDTFFFFCLGTVGEAPTR